MYKATTPTHTFDLNTDVSKLDKIIITYLQNGKTMLEKNQDDLTLGEDTVSYKFTQEETKLFKVGLAVVQVRIKTVEGIVLSSRDIAFNVHNTHNQEVI